MLHLILSPGPSISERGARLHSIDPSGICPRPCLRVVRHLASTLPSSPHPSGRGLGIGEVEPVWRFFGGLEYFGHAPTPWSTSPPSRRRRSGPSCATSSRCSGSCTPLAGPHSRSGSSAAPPLGADGDPPRAHGHLATPGGGDTYRRSQLRRRREGGVGCSLSAVGVGVPSFSAPSPTPFSGERVAPGPPVGGC